MSLMMTNAALSLRRCVPHILGGDGGGLVDMGGGGGVVDAESKMWFQRRKMENGFEEGEA